MLLYISFSQLSRNTHDFSIISSTFLHNALWYFPASLHTFPTLPFNASNFQFFYTFLHPFYQEIFANLLLSIILLQLFRHTLQHYPLLFHNLFSYFQPTIYIFPTFFLLSLVTFRSSKLWYPFIGKYSLLLLLYNNFSHVSRNTHDFSLISSLLLRNTFWYFPASLHIFPTFFSLSLVTFRSSKLLHPFYREIFATFATL